MLTDLIEALADASGPLLLLGVFLLAYGEGTMGLDLLVPGEAGVAIVAAAVAERGEPPLAAVIAAAASGALAGDSTGWAIGRRFGTPFAQRWRWTRRRVAPALERAHRYFEHRGGRAVFVARFVGALRAVVPIVAGAGAMPYRRFLAWDIPAALAWASLVATLGYVYGDDVAGVLDRVGVAISLVALVTIAVVVLWRRRSARSRRL